MLGAFCLGRRTRWESIEEEQISQVGIGPARGGDHGIGDRCGGSGGDSGGESQTATIGYSGPLSGGAALYGENALDGMQMTV
jgi:ABC-type branched-subunit amino acid transport system substrate-binding protein